MRPLVLLPVLLALPGAHAFTITGPDPVVAEVAAGDAPVTVEYRVLVHLDEASGLYIKLVPSPGNPAILNGTADGDGWWLEARLDGAGGTTNGSAPVRFGTLPAGNHSITLRLHMPAAAVADAAEHRVDVAVAQEAAPGVRGNGGTYHPAQSFALPVRVAAQEGTPAAEEDGALSPLAILLLVVIAAGVGVAIMLARRRPRP